MRKNIRAGIETLANILFHDQSPDGSWKYPFETGIATDCYMIILLRTLEIDDEKLIKALTKRILSRQENNGAWKLFFDEKDGNLSATLEAYYALLYSGYYKKSDAPLKAAKSFIMNNGGMEKAHTFTKIMLAITDHYEWPRFFPFPVELLLLPASIPIGFYSFSEFGRANMLPIMILADKRYSIRTGKSPDLSALHMRDVPSGNDFDEWRSFHTMITNEIRCLPGLPSRIHKTAIEQAERYMLARTEPDGTFLSYFSSTFLMIFALLSMGYPKTHPTITKAVEGLRNMQCNIDGHVHMQYTTATVWNTSLISHSLQEAGIPVTHQAIQKANKYLVKKQHHKYGDWAINNPKTLPGGWGFSHINTIHPDVDDTSATLRAIARKVSSDSSISQSWDRGTLWLLSMQNSNGGWPAFERNKNSRLLKLLPIEKAEFILTDPPGADLTGRTIEFFCSYTNLPSQHPGIRSALHWLLSNQEKDGSWYGRWGICYIYGTWGALTGLSSAGISSSNPAIVKGRKWLLTIQNHDGGWGESCQSDIEGRYIPLGASTLTQTAWACDSLISTSTNPSPELKKGIRYLLHHLEDDSWTERYPVGQGMAGGFYMHYHSYRYLFPLLALANYLKKFGST